MPSRASQAELSTNTLHQTSQRNIRRQNLVDISAIFVKACKEKDDKKIRACLTLGVDINSTDERDHSGLYHAVIFNRQLFDLLIDHPDLDIDQVNREKILARAIPCGAEVVRKLCNLPGIDVNAGNPLRRAVFFDRKNAMQLE